MKSLRAIRKVKESREEELLDREGVTGVDIGPKYTGGEKTDEVAIRVYVAEKKPEDDLSKGQRVPKTLNGIKTDVIERRFVLHPRYVRVTDLQTRADTGSYAPLKGGISIGPCRSIFMEPPDVEEPGNYVFVGTFGAVVEDRDTNEKMLLSNFHVMSVDDSWSAGDTMAQPSLVDGGGCPADVVAELSRAVLEGTTGASGPGVDAAVARHTARDIVCEIAEIGEVAGTAVASEGMHVRKRGRTTGLTHGTVETIDLTVVIPYGDGLGDVTLTKQIGIEVDTSQSAQFGNSGDSGSVVVDDDRNVVGLYFAGTDDGSFGVANPIDAVLDALNVRMCVSAPKPIKEFMKDFKDFKEKDGKDLKEKDLKDFKEKDGKDLKEKDLKDFKEKDGKDLKEKDLKDFKEKDGKDLKEKDLKDFKEKDGKDLKEKDLKDFKEKDLKEKDIFEGPGFPTEPRQPRPPVPEPFGPGPRARGMAPAGVAFGARGGDCIEFRSMPTGPRPNPTSVGGATFFARDHAGAPWPNPGVKDFGGHVGLDCGFELEIRWARPCPTIQATLVHFSSPATMIAFNSDGSLAGTASMSGPQRTPEALTIHGTNIDRVVIAAPQNETLLQMICCLPEGKGPGTEKPGPKELKEKPEPKEFKEKREPKEFKEKPEPKELKEKPEPKEFKEKREPKEFKEKPEPKELREKNFKEPKEVRETPHDPFQPPHPAQPGPRNPLEERLARLEAAIAQMTHFIGTGSRPDLSSGALKREADYGKGGKDEGQ